MERLPGPLGIALLEATIANTEARPDLRPLLQPAAQAWTLEFPSLRSLVAGAEGTPGAPLRICIATHDIVGPAASGGPARHHSRLALALAAQGHQVTVLYLRDRDAEVAWIGDWAEFYAGLGVTFVAEAEVPPAMAAWGDVPAGQPVDALAHAMYRHLQEADYDIVHAPAAGGPAYLALLAKAQGLRFQSCHFVIHAGGGLLARHLYAGAPLTGAGDLVRLHAEQHSVEMADHVVAASAHELRWLAAQGYALPAGRCFVQPALVPAELAAATPAPEAGVRPGDPVPVRHLLAVIGLDPLGGGDLLCQALATLLRQGVALPERITLQLCPQAAGQGGDRWQDEAALRRIRAAARDWPGEVTLATGPAPHGPMAEEGTLVLIAAATVLPEAVGALAAGLPLLMLDNGPAPELLAAGDRADAICAADAAALTEALRRVLTKGARVPRAAEDALSGGRVWLAYHRMFGAAGADGVPPPQDLPPLEVVLPYRDRPDLLAVTLSALEASDYPGLQVTVVVEGDFPVALATRLQARGWRLVDAPSQGLAVEAALDAAVAGGEGGFIYLTRPGHAPGPGALRKLAVVARLRGLAAVTTFAQVQDAGAAAENGALHLPILGNLALSLLCPDPAPLDLLLDRAAVQAVGGLQGAGAGGGAEAALCHALQLAGHRLETLPEVLLTLPAAEPAARAAVGLRGMGPVLRQAPLILRDLLLAGHGAAHAQPALAEDLHRALAARDTHRAELLTRIVERDAARTRALETERHLAHRDKELAAAEARSAAQSARMSAQLEELQAKLKLRNDELKALRARQEQAASASEPADGAKTGPGPGSEIGNLRDKLKARNAELVVQREKLDALRAQLKSLEAVVPGPSAEELRRRLSARNDEVVGLRQKLRDLRAQLAAQQGKAPE